ncbi:hypothetical protein ACLF3G_15435 [Falsiroseomonas sp. HC035]|uniref:hypothetical protein n=1 Tax=Falsiroseomonas sp. HC035 TaxID=3390999 RepID=UPI003D31A7AD
MAGIKQTFAMAQGEVLGNDQVFQATFHAPLDDPKRAGICCGLSMLWVRNLITHHKRTAEQRKEGLRTAAAYAKAGETQDIHHRDSPTADSYENWVQRSYGSALRNNTLRAVTSSLICKESSAPGTLAKTMESAAQAKHSYRLYFLRMQPVGKATQSGHVVASYASSGKIFGWGRHLYFFDCESGEYKVDIAETNRWLTVWLQAWQTRGQKLLELRSFAVEAGV